MWGVASPSQTWRTFLANHVKQIVVADFFVVPTATYRLLFVLVLLARDRRRIEQVTVTTRPAPGPRNNSATPSRVRSMTSRPEYRAGETWFENPGSYHRVSENASTTEPARVLAVFIVDAEDKQ